MLINRSTITISNNVRIETISSRTIEIGRWEDEIKMDIDRPFSRVTFHEFRKWKSGRILGGLGLVDLFCSCSRRKVAGSRETKGWSRSGRGGGGGGYYHSGAEAYITRPPLSFLTGISAKLSPLLPRREESRGGDETRARVWHPAGARHRAPGGQRRA